MFYSGSKFDILFEYKLSRKVYYFKVLKEKNDAEIVYEQ